MSIKRLWWKSNARVEEQYIELNAVTISISGRQGQLFVQSCIDHISLYINVIQSSYMPCSSFFLLSRLRSLLNR